MIREETLEILDKKLKKMMTDYQEYLEHTGEPLKEHEKWLHALNMAIEALRQERPKGRWVPVHKHMWRKYDGEIDTDAWECGYHNGPVCELCGKHICINCNPDWAKDECDIESYRCSECNHHAKEKTGFCPNCGAEMER